jgi:hypothetical protein
MFASKQEGIQDTLRSLEMKAFRDLSLSSPFLLETYKCKSPLRNGRMLTRRIKECPNEPFVIK